MSGLPSHPAQLPPVPTPELAPRSKSQPLLDGGREKNTTSPSNGSILLPIHHGDGANGEVMPPANFAERMRRILQVRPTGESGRRGFNPLQFVKITMKSSNLASRIVNVLWPIVPAAIAVRYAIPENHLVTFILSYLAMVPCANLLGFAGQELARKVPHVMGVLTETT